MNPYKVILVEDEAKSRSRLKEMLEGWAGTLEIVGEAITGTEAKSLIARLKPDLVFMDIELPGANGLEVLANTHPQPAVIFTTAYSEHAIPAFKIDHPIGYLLKPIKIGDLEAAIHKFLAQHKKRFLSRIQCEIGNTIYPVKVQDIVYLQAEEKYTTVKTSQKCFVIRTPIYALEKDLDPDVFVRIHRSAIINLEWLKEIVRTDEGKMQVVMKDEKNSQLTASRGYGENLRFY